MEENRFLSLDNGTVVVVVDDTLLSFVTDIDYRGKI